MSCTYYICMHNLRLASTPISMKIQNTMERMIFILNEVTWALTRSSMHGIYELVWSRQRAIRFRSQELYGDFYATLLFNYLFPLSLFCHSIKYLLPFLTPSPFVFSPLLSPLVPSALPIFFFPISVLVSSSVYTR